MNFGFLLNNRNINVDGIEIKPLDDYDKIIKHFHETARVSNGWIYPPLQSVSASKAEKSLFTNRAFDKPAKFYHVRPTHLISTDTGDIEKERFLILAYGFINGLYLVPSTNLCLQKIPYKEGKLTGLYLIGNDCEKGISTINTYYNRATSEEISQMFAIMHWFLIGQTYEYEWDRFDAQYKVLDGLHNISGLNIRCHACRPIELAKHYRIPIPSWAKIIKKKPKESKLSKLRNELVHEAKYAGFPIGYEYPEVNFNIGLVAFNVKLIASVIGLKTAYFQVDCNSASMYGWKFI